MSKKRRKKERLQIAIVQMASRHLPFSLLFIDSTYLNSNRDMRLPRRLFWLSNHGIHGTVAF